MNSRNFPTKRNNSEPCIREAISSELKINSTSGNNDVMLSVDPQLKKKRKRPKHHSIWMTFRGFLYVFLASTATVFLSILVKKLETVHTGELSMFRLAGAFFASLPILTFDRRNPFGPKGSRTMLFLRGLFEASSVHFIFLALRMLPLAEAAVIVSMVPVVTFTLARIFLKELCSVIHATATMISFCGVMLAIRIPVIIAEGQFSPAADFTHSFGIFVAFCCVLCKAVSNVALRKVKDVHYGVVMFASGLVGAAESAVILAAWGSFSLPRCGLYGMWNVMVAILGFLGQYFTILALQIEGSGLFAIMKASFDILQAMMIHVIVFGKYLDIFDISGGILVLFSLGIIAFNKWWEQEPPKSCRFR